MVAAQYRDGEPIECDQANAAGGLGVTDRQFATVVLELPVDQERPTRVIRTASSPDRSSGGFCSAR